MHSHHTDSQRMAFWHRTFAQQSECNWDACTLCQFLKFLAGTGHGDAVPSQDDGLLGLLDEFECIGDLFFGSVLRRVIAGQCDFAFRVDKLDLFRLNVLGNIDEHRAGPTCAGDVERFFDDVRQFADIAH